MLSAEGAETLKLWTALQAAPSVTVTVYVPPTSMTATSPFAGGVPLLHFVPSDQFPETAAFHVLVAACPVNVANRVPMMDTVPIQTRQRAANRWFMMGPCSVNGARHNNTHL